MAYLTVKPSRGEPLIFELKDDEVSIGSDDSCDLTIDDPHIDPLHAVIRRKDDVYLVENRSRQMATYLNYLPTEEADIFPGDEITVGQSSLIFEEEVEENSGAEKMVELVADNDLETTVGSTLPGG